MKDLPREGILTMLTMTLGDHLFSRIQALVIPVLQKNGTHQNIQKLEAPLLRASRPPSEAKVNIRQASLSIRVLEILIYEYLIHLHPIQHCKGKLKKEEKAGEVQVNLAAEHQEGLNIPWLHPHRTEGAGSQTWIECNNLMKSDVKCKSSN